MKPSAGRKATLSRKAFLAEKKALAQRRKVASAFAPKNRFEELDHDMPSPTDTTAPRFVKLLNAGVPILDALTYFAPDYRTALDASLRRKTLSDPDHRRLMVAWQQRWMTSERVVKELDRFRGGKWEDLTDQARVELAKKLHVQQLAYFLYTTDYSDPLAPMAKIADARKALHDLSTGGDGDADFFERFMRHIMQQEGGPKTMGVEVKRTKATTSARIVAGKGIVTKELPGPKVLDAEVVKH